MGDNIDKSDNTQLLDIPQSDGTVYRLSYWKDMENTFNVKIHQVVFSIGICAPSQLSAVLSRDVGVVLSFIVATRYTS